MAELNRLKRQTLRRIQEYINTTRQRHGLSVQQAGVMDVYYHVSDDLESYNYVTPRRGVAWVPGTDILAALDQLGKHHAPRLEMLEGLFPPAFHRQLGLLGLTAHRYTLQTYGLIEGCDQIAESFDPAPPTPPRIATFEAADRHAIATWLRLHGRPTEPAEIERCWTNMANDSERYWLACDDYVMAGGLALNLDPPLAELRSLYTAEQYRKRGIASALIRAAVLAAQQRGCTLIFAINQRESDQRLYNRLGFVPLDQVLIYERTANPPSSKEPTTADEHPLAQPIPESG